MTQIVFNCKETHFLLPSATKLRRLCFYGRLCVHRGVGVSASMDSGIHTPPGAAPPDQTPPQSRPPREQIHPPRSRHPRDQTPPTPEQTSPGSRHPPEQTPPWSRHPLWSRHLPWSRPPQSRHPPPEIRSLLRTVRILLECILVGSR